jgi:hypothetical protein
MDSTFSVFGAKIFDLGEWDLGYSMIMQPDSNLLLSGFSHIGGLWGPSDISMARFHFNGDIDSSFGVNGAMIIDYGGDEYCRSSVLRMTGEIILGGYFYDGSNADFALYQFQNSHLLGIADNENESEKISLTPNPFYSSINIVSSNNESREIIIYDISSRKVLAKGFNNSIKLDTEHFAKGVYIYEVRNKNKVVKQGKLIKE